MKMFDPAHPGEVLLEDVLKPLGLSITRAARHLGVARQTLNNVCLGKAGISSEMALKIEAAFGGSADHWVNMQTNYELAQARRNQDAIVEGVEAFEMVA